MFSLERFSYRCSSGCWWTYIQAWIKSGVMTNYCRQDGQQVARGTVNTISMGQGTTSRSSIGGMMGLNISCDPMKEEKTKNEDCIFSLVLNTQWRAKGTKCSVGASTIMQYQIGRRWLKPYASQADLTRMMLPFACCDVGYTALYSSTKSLRSDALHGAKKLLNHPLCWWLLKPSSASNMSV